VNIFGQVLVLVYQKENTVNKKIIQNNQSLLMPSLQQQNQTNKQTNKHFMHGIELPFPRYFGNLNLNVRYRRIILPDEMRFFHPFGWRYSVKGGWTNIIRSFYALTEKAKNTF